MREGGYEMTGTDEERATGRGEIPPGYTWQMHEDGSGALTAPNGRTVAAVDFATREYWTQGAGWSPLGERDADDIIAAAAARDEEMDSQRARYPEGTLIRESEEDDRGYQAYIPPFNAAWARRFEDGSLEIVHAHLTDDDESPTGLAWYYTTYEDTMEHPHRANYGHRYDEADGGLMSGYETALECVRDCAPVGWEIGPEDEISISEFEQLTRPSDDPREIVHMLAAAKAMNAPGTSPYADDTPIAGKAAGDAALARWDAADEAGRKELLAELDADLPSRHNISSIRQLAAKHCGFPELFANDKDQNVRAAVASTGYNLEAYVHDMNPTVREAVASCGYGLDELVHDENWRVRLAVARQEWGLDALVDDKEAIVRYVANELLKKMDLEPGEWAAANPDKCTLEENGRRMEKGAPAAKNPAKEDMAKGKSAAQGQERAAGAASLDAKAHGKRA